MFIIFRLVSILIFCNLVLADLDTSLMKIINSNNNNNFLVRGNLPVKNKKFQYKELRKSLNELTGIDDYKLVVISLMNSLTGKESTNRKI